jgi:hypothetical protein
MHIPKRQTLFALSLVATVTAGMKRPSFAQAASSPDKLTEIADNWSQANISHDCVKLKEQIDAANKELGGRSIDKSEMPEPLRRRFKGLVVISSAWMDQCKTASPK